ncbi:hypothetical protein ACLK1T_29145 [Escherichia coli]
MTTQASWGHNNRTVALRIPCGNRHNHRVDITWRVRCQPISGDGGDSAGILHGLDNELLVAGGVEGNGLERMAYPSRFARAMPGSFIGIDHLHRYLGERFCHVYHACKNDELLQFDASSQKQKLSGC